VKVAGSAREERTVSKTLALGGAAAASLVGTVALALSLSHGRATPHPVRSPATGSAPPRFIEHVDASVFQKGNLHTHTWLSDGDSGPRTVAAWYAAHGYAFLAITDHNVYGDATTLPGAGVLVIPGEEVTMRTPRGPVHVNALCHQHEIGGHLGLTVAGALDWATKRIGEQHGVVVVNHPNYHWVLGDADLAAAGEVPALLEIYSPLPGVHAAGDTEHPSSEALWERALSSGAAYTGVAVDDTHQLKRRRRNLRAGRGWVQVFASAARQDLVCDALARGRLYASSGAEIDRLVVAGDTISVWPSAAPVTVEFLGRDGRVLARRELLDLDTASYRLDGSEDFVRARITDDKRHRAWTAAYRVSRD
jgi:hypothetical protein